MAEKIEKPMFKIEALEKYLSNKRIRVGLNLISNSIEYAGYSSAESPEHILNTMPTLIFSEISGAYKQCTVANIQNYLLVIATRNRFNPVIDLIKSVRWDGVDREAELCKILSIDCFDILSHTLIKKWLWQGVSLLQNSPEAPFGADGILTLTGAQGLGKTSLFRKLSIKPEWFNGGQVLSDRDKDTYRRAVTHWITELGELESTFKSDISALKAFVTAEYDRYRLPYGRVDENNARRTNLCATCNSSQFLIDETGNRRFWTININSIDLVALNKLDGLQLWAQVYAQHGSDLQGFRLTKDEQAELAERNNIHEKPIKAESEVSDILSEATGKNNLWKDVTVTTFKSNYKSLERYSAADVGKALDKLGIQAKWVKVSGSSQRVRRLPIFSYYP